MKALCASAAILLLVGGMCSSVRAAGPPTRHALLVLATLDKVSKISGAPPDSPPDVLYLGRPFRHEFKILKVLAGDTKRNALTLDFLRASWPATGAGYFLIVSGTDDDLSAQWWSPTEDGLCVDLETAEKVKLVAAIKGLQAQYPCTVQPWNFVR
jgi:hypothetical protein